MLYRKSLFFLNTLQVLKQASFYKTIESVLSICSQRRYRSNDKRNDVFSSSTNPDRHKLAERSPVENKTLMTNDEIRTIKKWLEMAEYEGEILPRTIVEDDLLDFSQIECEEERKEHLRYLVRREKNLKSFERRRKQKLKEKAKLQKEIEIKPKDQEIKPKGHIEYGELGNSLLLMPDVLSEADLYNHRLVSAMKFGQKLVIDLGFDDYLDRKAAPLFAKNLAESLAINRACSEPFNITLCNVNFNSKPYNKFIKVMPSVASPTFPMNITSKSYLDIFPKEKLIYLSPDATYTMKRFDHKAIYIIGGLEEVEKKEEPLTLEKAKRDNIKTLKFPLDWYHMLYRNNLPIHVVMAILLEINISGDWNKAFDYIPSHLDDTETKTGNPFYFKRPY